MYDFTRKRNNRSLRAGDRLPGGSSRVYQCESDSDFRQSRTQLQRPLRQNECIHSGTVKKSRHVSQTDQLYEYCLWCGERLTECETLQEVFTGSRSLCLNCQKKLHPLFYSYKVGKKKVWITYQYEEELESLFDRIFRLHDPDLGQVLLEDHEDWLKPLKNYPLMAVDCLYEAYEFHTIFSGLVLRDIRRVNRRTEKRGKYVVVALFPLEPSKIEDLLAAPYCVGVWMLSQKVEWIPFGFFKQISEKIRNSMP